MADDTTTPATAPASQPGQAQQPDAAPVERAWIEAALALLDSRTGNLGAAQANVTAAISALSWQSTSQQPITTLPFGLAAVTEVAIERLHLREVSATASVALPTSDTAGQHQLVAIEGSHDAHRCRNYLVDRHSDWLYVAHDPLLPTDAGPWPAETLRTRRGHAFYPTDPIHRLYATTDIPLPDKVIRAHYFLGGFDWWLVEAEADFDPDYPNDSGAAFVLGWGYACLNDPDMAEWGTVNLTELETIQVHGGIAVVERDLHWQPVRAADAKLPGSPF